MKKILTEKSILVLAGLLILLAFLFSSYTAIKSFTLKPGESTVISGGATVQKPTNNIVDASLSDDGYLIVKYEDGSTKQVGYILGEKGDKGDSISPTQAQIAVAVTNYCQQDNRCDAKSPTPEQVAAAVTNYCSTRNECAGVNGVAGQNATDAQVMAAVASYCSANNKCQGQPGLDGGKGDKGDVGTAPIMACVQQATPPRFYVAWKYVGENDTLYDATSNPVGWRLLYKIDKNDPVNPCTEIKTT